MKITENAVCFWLHRNTAWEPEYEWSSLSDCPTVRCVRCRKKVPATQLLPSCSYDEEEYWAEYRCPCGMTTLLCAFETSVRDIVRDMTFLGKIDRSLAERITSQLVVEATLATLLREQKRARRG